MVSFLDSTTQGKLTASQGLGNTGGAWPRDRRAQLHTRLSVKGLMRYVLVHRTNPVHTGQDIFTTDFHFTTAFIFSGPGQSWAEAPSPWHKPNISILI